MSTWWPWLRAVALSLTFQATEEGREPHTAREFLRVASRHPELVPLWLIRLGTEEWFSKMPT